MRWVWMRLAGWAGIGVWLLILASSVRAQQTPMEIAAAQLTGPIVHSKQRTIAVFDFSGPEGRMTQLGRQLADELSAALAKSPSLKVEDRSRVEEEQAFYVPQAASDPESEIVFAQELGAKAFVSGKISQGQHNLLNVELDVYRANNGKGIHAFVVSFPLDDAMAKLVATGLVDNGEADFSKYPTVKQPGYSPPFCSYCPRADYSPQALGDKVQGVVELEAIVEEDGRITHVRVLRPLPGGLTAEAIKAVRKWKLRPATGPDGKPVAVREIIEVAFQLF